MTMPSIPAHVSTYGPLLTRHERPVFLLHGAGMDQSVWTLQGRYLAFHGWNAFAVDLPGHGRGRGHDALTSIGDMAEWLAGVIEQVEGGPAVLIGHSMGALLALDLAARWPDQIASLVLAGAAASMPVHPYLLQLAAAGDPKAVELMVDWAFGRRGHVGGNASPGGWMMGAARSLLLRGKPGVLASDLAACAAYAGGTEAASRIRCPCMVLIGSEDRMTPPGAGRALAAGIAGAKVEVIEGAGHMMMLEAPEAALDAIRHFVA